MEWVYSGTRNTHTYLLTYLLPPDPHEDSKYGIKEFSVKLF